MNPLKPFATLFEMEIKEKRPIIRELKIHALMFIQTIVSVLLLMTLPLWILFLAYAAAREAVTK